MKKQWSFISRIAMICMAFLLVVLNAATLVSCSESEKICRRIRNYKVTSEEDFINLASECLPNWSFIKDLNMFEYDYGDGPYGRDMFGGDINYQQLVVESLDGYEQYEQYKSDEHKAFQETQAFYRNDSLCEIIKNGDINDLVQKLYDAHITAMTIRYFFMFGRFGIGSTSDVLVKKGGYYLPFDYILLLESNKSNELLESMIEGCLKPHLNDPESLVIYEQVMIINPERAERKDWYSSLGTLVVDYGAKNQYGGMTRRIATIKVKLLSNIYELYIESMDTSSDVFS